jgi:hypothetical protein
MDSDAEGSSIAASRASIISGSATIRALVAPVETNALGEPDRVRRGELRRSHLDPERTLKIGPTNEREVRESGLWLKA